MMVMMVLVIQCIRVKTGMGFDKLRELDKVHGLIDWPAAIAGGCGHSSTLSSITPPPLCYRHHIIIPFFLVVVVIIIISIIIIVIIFLSIIIVVSIIVIIVVVIIDNIVTVGTGIAVGVSWTLLSKARNVHGMGRYGHLFSVSYGPGMVHSMSSSSS